MNEMTIRRLPSGYRVALDPYIYRCFGCGQIERVFLHEDAPQASPQPCGKCGSAVEPFSLDSRSEGAAILWSSRPLRFKLAQYLNLAQAWRAGRITSRQALRGFGRPQHLIWFADQCARGMVCVCPEVLAELDSAGGHYQSIGGIGMVTTVPGEIALADSASLGALRLIADYAHREVYRVDAPSTGWTSATLARELETGRCYAESFAPVDAFVGDQWIGSTEV